MSAVPAVSVCIPMLNGEEFVAAAIRSVLEQDGVDFEILVCDNLSHDRGAQIAASFSDPRIRVLTNPRRLDMCENWNRVIAEARAPWIKVLPCDDRLTAGSLAREFAATACASVPAFVAGPKVLCTRSGRALRTVRRLAAGSYMDEQLRDALIASPTNLVGEPGCVLFRREAWVRVGGFETSLHYYCDVDFYIRILSGSHAVILHEPSCLFRLHGGSMSFRQTRRIAAEFTDFRARFLTDGRPGFLLRRWVATTVWLRQAAIRLMDRY